MTRSHGSSTNQSHRPAPRGPHPSNPTTNNSSHQSNRPAPRGPCPSNPRYPPPFRPHTLVFTWGSSHFTPHRRFPPLMFDQLGNSGKFHWKRDYSCGGAKLSQEKVDKITSVVDKYEGEHQLHVIHLGKYSSL